MTHRRRQALILCLLTASLAVAGCVDVDPFGSQEDTRDGTMTAEHEVREDEGLGPDVPPYHAREVHILTGELTLEALPVVLTNVNGPINVTTEPGSSWHLVARLTGYGTTQEEAREQLDRLSFNWSIGTPQARALEATVSQENQDQQDQLVQGRTGSSIDLVLPQALLPTIRATSINGEANVQALEAATLELTVINGRVHVRDTQADRLTATATNGMLDVVAGGTQEAQLTATNGGVAATIDPGTTGTLAATSVNGGVDLRVPEDASHGYDAQATSTNGLAMITLQDGQRSDPTDPGHATFKTDGYDDRAIRTTVTVTSTNGAVHLGPASS